MSSRDEIHGLEDCQKYIFVFFLSCIDLNSFAETFSNERTRTPDFSVTLITFEWKADSNSPFLNRPTRAVRKSG